MRTVRNSLVSIVIILLLSLFLPSCQIGENMNHSQISIHGHVADNARPLSDILTVEYELQDLKDFFGEISLNEKLLYTPSVQLSGDDSGLTIDNVNKHFPIECLREEYYTVYKVKEGGYYYVFWDLIADSQSDGLSSPLGRTSDAVVYFTAYLSSSSPKKVSDFNTIKEGHSTAADVAAIDPALELNFLLSSRTASYSLLEDGMMMEVCYAWNQDPISRNNLIVTKTEVIPKSLAPARLASILELDLIIES